MFLSKLDGYDDKSGQYFDLEGNPAELPKNPFYVGVDIPQGYSDFGTIPENWVNYSIPLISQLIIGFKDILNVRSIVKPLILEIAGFDFSNFDNLNSGQKIIALTYFPTKIISEQGFIFFATKAGGVLQANIYIDNYQDLSQPIRRTRYNELSKFVYGHLWKDDSLKAERLVQLDALDISFIRRGVVFNSEDNIDGLGDWLQSTSGYVITGLKNRILLGEFTIKTGLPLNDFITACVDIIDNGIY